jgi:SHAQKYF class myb-like DNA-binding protein
MLNPSYEWIFYFSTYYLCSSFSSCAFIRRRWTAEEHSKFLEGVMKFGKDWKKMQPLIKTRSLVQIRTHAQKVFKNVGLKVLTTLSTHQIRYLSQDGMHVPPPGSSNISTNNCSSDLVSQHDMPLSTTAGDRARVLSLAQTNYTSSENSSLTMNTLAYTNRHVEPISANAVSSVVTSANVDNAASETTQVAAANAADAATAVAATLAVATKTTSTENSQSILSAPLRPRSTSEPASMHTVDHRIASSYVVRHPASFNNWVSFECIYNAFVASNGSYSCVLYTIGGISGIVPISATTAANRDC